MKIGSRWLTAVLIVISPSMAFAHPAVGQASGLLNGLAHPIGGLDHLCAMVAVGLWAAQRGGRATWLVPLAFVSVMAIGGVLAMLGFSLPLVEQGIIASVLVLGLLIAGAVGLPLPASVLVVGLFALFHGHAHGSEMPQNMSGVAYAVGFVAATVMLNLCGILLGVLARQTNTMQLLRYAGAAIILCGLWLCMP